MVYTTTVVLTIRILKHSMQIPRFEFTVFRLKDPIIKGFNTNTVTITTKICI